MLDEPTSGLDSESAVAIMKLMQDLARQVTPKSKTGTHATNCHNQGTNDRMMSWQHFSGSDVPLVPHDQSRPSGRNAQQEGCGHQWIA